MIMIMSGPNTHILSHEYLASLSHHQHQLTTPPPVTTVAHNISHSHTHGVQSQSSHSRQKSTSSMQSSIGVCSDAYDLSLCATTGALSVAHADHVHHMQQQPHNVNSYNKGTCMDYYASEVADLGWFGHDQSTSMTSHSILVGYDCAGAKTHTIGSTKSPFDLVITTSTDEGNHCHTSHDLSTTSIHIGVIEENLDEYMHSPLPKKEASASPNSDGTCSSMEERDRDGLGNGDGDVVNTSIRRLNFDEPGESEGNNALAVATNTKRTSCSVTASVEQVNIAGLKIPVNLLTTRESSKWVEVVAADEWSPTSLLDTISSKKTGTGFNSKSDLHCENTTKGSTPKNGNGGKRVAVPKKSESSSSSMRASNNGNVVRQTSPTGEQLYWSSQSSSPRSFDDLDVMDTIGRQSAKAPLDPCGLSGKLPKSLTDDDIHHMMSRHSKLERSESISVRITIASDCAQLFPSSQAQKEETTRNNGDAVDDEENASLYDSDYYDSWEIHTASVCDNDNSIDSWLVLNDKYCDDFCYDMPFEILGTSVDDKSCHPHVLSPPLMDYLHSFLPKSMAEANFFMKYSLVRDGATLPAMLQRVRGCTHTILAVETTNGEVFGSFTSAPWRVEHSYL
jgi:hypothetical protein